MLDEYERRSVDPKTENPPFILHLRYVPSSCTADLRLATKGPDQLLSALEAKSSHGPAKAALTLEKVAKGAAWLLDTGKLPPEADDGSAAVGAAGGGGKSSRKQGTHHSDILI